MRSTGKYNKWHNFIQTEMIKQTICRWGKKFTTANVLPLPMTNRLFLHTMKAERKQSHNYIMAQAY